MKRDKVGKNKKGGIEGLPLQLLIIIVVASLGLTTMVGWMNNIEEPTTISRVEVVKNQVNGSEYDIQFTVYDNKDNPVQGATIVLSGLGVMKCDGQIQSVSTDNFDLEKYLYEERLKRRHIGFMDTMDQVNEYLLNKLKESIANGEIVVDQDYMNAYDGAPIEYLGTVSGSQSKVPVIMTDDNGVATVKVNFTGLSGYGHFNYEVSKSGYGTYGDTEIVSE